MNDAPLQTDRASKDDFDVLAPMVMESQIFQKTELEQRAIDHARFRKELERTLKDALDDEEKAYFIAREGEQPVGYAFARIDNPLTGEGSINDLYVKDAFRRHGIAKSLTDRAIEWFRLNEVTKIWIAVHRDNVAGKHLYEGLGFTEADDGYVWMKKTVA